MKKIFTSLLFIFSSLMIFAQNAQRQMLIPHTVYVGDTAQLHISFSGKNELLKTEEPNHKGNQTVELATEGFERPLDNSKYSVKQILLSKTGIENDKQSRYELVIIFVPWTTGNIKFPPYKLDESFSIIPSEITIDSIFNAPKVSRKFAENKGPLLIPGTTYRILFKLLFHAIILILIITALCKWKTISLKYKNYRLKRLYKKNRRHAVSILLRIKSAVQADKVKAERIQRVMRHYLTVRFGYNFNRSGASEIWSGFETIFQGLLSEKKEDAVEELISLFTRTDFIRYSANGSFEKKEIYSITDRLIEIIDILETPAEKNPQEDNL